jgi:hypothetical protein
MDRRCFLRIAGLSSIGLGSLLKSNLVSARGIPAAFLPGTAPDRCYAGAPKGVIVTSLTDIFKIGRDHPVHIQ